MTHEKFEKLIQNTYDKDDVTLLRAVLANTIPQRPDVEYVTIFSGEVVLTMSNDKRHFSNNFIRFT